MHRHKPSGGRRNPPLDPAAAKVDDDPLMSARESAAELNISLPGFWKGVEDMRFPQPLYVLPRAPRWRRSELWAAVERLRMRPADAKAARRIKATNR